MTGRIAIISTISGVESLLTSLATGLSYYYDRCSKMAATTLYPTVTLVLMDTDGTSTKTSTLLRLMSRKSKT